MSVKRSFIKSSQGTGLALPPTTGCVRAEPRLEGVVVRHALFWLMAANAVGLGLACLLLVPEWNGLAGPWTYGRWMPVHMNLQLYGWTSLPLLAWLFRVYRVGQTPAGAYGRSAIWVWSTALAVGVMSWLAGGSSGKLFLDWRGYARILFAAAMLVLWGILAWSWMARRVGPRLPKKSALTYGVRALARRALNRSAWGWRARSGRAAALAQGIGLVVLLPVPMIWFWAASPEVYPAVNPDSGGPTGASLLGSTLIVVLLVLVFPLTLGKRPARGRWRARLAWSYFLAEMVLYGVLNRSHASHHEAAQILGLGSLVPWLVVLPVYYRGFDWPKAARRWERGFLFWIGLLLLTGWLSFLPGFLDRLKFTNGLVAHAHLAMAGFVTCFNAFLLCVLLEGSPAEGVLARRAPFWMWQAGTLMFISAMWVSGWIEGAHPSFTVVPSGLKNLLFGIRAGCGAAMFAASVVWWRAAWRAEDWAGRKHGAMEPGLTMGELAEGLLPWPESRPNEVRLRPQKIGVFHHETHKPHETKTDRSFSV